MSNREDPAVGNVDPPHWIYSVLQENPILLSCLFYESPSEMFNLPFSCRYDESIRNAIIDGIKSGALILNGCENNTVDDWIKLVEEASYLPPIERKDQQQVFLVLRGAEGASNPGANKGCRAR